MRGGPVLNGPVLNGTAAIAGIGATEFSKDSGRSELRLAVEAITAALADAGLARADIDGLVTFTMDGNAEIAVARELGLRELRFFSQVGYGGGAACGCVQHAAMAVATGTADVVVCYRALNERSGRRFGQVAAGLAGNPTTAGVDNGWHYPMGLATPAAMVAMIARRYMHEYGATSEDFGQVAVADRRHAASNPNAWFYQRPVTLAEHQASRWIAEPLRLLDCCQESDGAVAIVVTSAARARDLRQRPAVIAAAAQGSGPGQYIMTSYYRDDFAALPEMGVVARQLWRQAGIGPADVRTAVLYDHFTPYVLLQLEELGFCERGEARHFISGGAIEIGGRLPLNPHGGQLGEAYIHGMNGIAEAVRQVRGTSVNEVPGDGPVLVTAGTGVPTSGLILSLPHPAPGATSVPARCHRDRSAAC
jgi:acetyl-CoA acetyltransferase